MSFGTLQVVLHIINRRVSFIAVLQQREPQLISQNEHLDAFKPVLTQPGQSSHVSHVLVARGDRKWRG